MWRHVVVPLIAMGLLACSQAPEKTEEVGRKLLTGDELRARYAEPVSLYWSGSRDLTGTVAFTPDGSVTLNLTSDSWNGSWEIVGDTLCTEFPERERLCETQFQQSNGNIVSYGPDGSLVSTTRLIME